MKKLQGKNILLRAIEPSDLRVMYEWENDVTLWHLSGTVQPFSEYSITEFINLQGDIYTSKQLRLMIECNGKAVGCVDLFEFDVVNRRAGIGIIIAENERKKMYASEAIDVIIKYAFNTLHLYQLYCNIMIDNIPSLRLFKKYGFRISGCKKSWLLVDNKWKDEYILQLIHDEK